MKLRYLLPLLALCAVSTLPADDARPATPADDLSAFKTADELWAHFLDTQQKPAKEPATREEGLATAQTWLAGQQKAGEAFASAYPKDARRWQAKLIALRRVPVPFVTA